MLLRHVAKIPAPGQEMKTGWKDFVRRSCGNTLAALALWSALPSFAQGTRADYERSRNLRHLTENKVSRDRVQPHWLPGGIQFWYQVKTGTDSREFILEDAERG